MAYISNIFIRWTYPKEIYSAWNSEDSYGRGVYQITRKFGNKNTLLYIGLVKKANRHFYERLDEHWPWLESIRGKVYISFGIIQPRQGLRITEDMIETIEGVLIWEYQPVLNDKKLNSFTIHKDMIIHSYGYRGFIDRVLETKDYEA